MCLWYEKSLNDEKSNEFFYTKLWCPVSKCSAISACLLSRQHTRAGCWCLLSPQELLGAEAPAVTFKGPQAVLAGTCQRSKLPFSVLLNTVNVRFWRKKPTCFTNLQFFTLADLLKYPKTSICSYPFTQQLTSKSAKATAVNDTTVPTTICSHHKSSLCWI